MKRVTSGLLGLGLVASLGFAYASPSTASSPAPPTNEFNRADKSQDDLPNPLNDKRSALRESALTAVLNGEAKPVQKNGSTVVKVGTGASPADAAGNSLKGKKLKKFKKNHKKAKKQNQYVELSQERADKIFVILAEFGDQRHPSYPDDVDFDPDTPGPERHDGPMHNTIPEPDRTVDNSSNWAPDYNQEHYQDLYFKEGEGVESLKTYYETQSSGRYTVDGQVSEWVKVPYNTARYGRYDSTTWALIRDAVAVWTQDRHDEGMSDAEIADALAEFDVYDRYDFDGDGDFNEPDGYIDHFQIVHAGAGEEDGSSLYGEDAIWSHRWYAYYTDAGITGPADNQLGGTQIGNSDIWIGDYTVQPENGGLSVFAHEYGHDLGLPDAYDTSGGGDNSNEYWTLMAQSRLNAEGEPLGTRPGDLGAWEKLQLGWLDYEALSTHEKRTLKMGPQEYNTKNAQGAVVVLPKKEVAFDNGAPATGDGQFYSTMGDDIDTRMSTELDLSAASTAEFSAQARWNIEAGYDYAYFQASTDGGTSWTSLPGTIDGAPYGTDTSGNPALDGEHADWGDLVVPLDDYAGQSILFRVQYRTDGGVAEQGLFLDDTLVTADGSAILDEGAEDGPGAWEFDGFTIVGAETVQDFDNYYVMGHRTYKSYDKYLKTGPYNFGFNNTKPDWVEHYKYGHGLLISYWDTSVADNNTNVHPGSGRNLPIDANPRPIINIATGNPWRARIQMYDAPFSKHKADSMTLHTNGVPSYIRGQKAKPLFDDTKKYWYSELPNHGVKLPAAGVKVRVLKEKGTGLKVKFN